LKKYQDKISIICLPIIVKRRFDKNEGCLFEMLIEKIISKFEGLKRRLIQSTFYPLCNLANIFRNKNVDKSLCLCILYLYYDKIRYPKSYKYVKQLMDYYKRRFTVTMICIDNKMGISHFDAKNNIHFINGDNSEWEFSGWQRGIDFIHHNNVKCNMILFVNDAFLNWKNRGFTLEYYKYHFRSEVLKAYGHTHVIGFTDYHAKEEKYKGAFVSRWLRSNVFCVPYDISLRIKMVGIEDNDKVKILETEYSDSYYKSVNLFNEKLAGFLQKWFANGWSNLKKDRYITHETIKLKIVAVVNERLLTYNLRTMGIHFYEIKPPICAKEYIEIDNSTTTTLKSNICD
jgi:hypothetical protein